MQERAAESLDAVDDESFIAAFEACRVSPAAWNHQAHIRMAWIYLRRHSFDEALARIRTGLQRLNALHQVPDELERGYHETLTRAWLQLVAAMIRHRGHEGSSMAFCAANPQLLCKSLMRLYYTRDRIVSIEAKRQFVTPDVAPLPQHDTC